jgi:hypothetical protein
MTEILDKMEAQLEQLFKEQSNLLETRGPAFIAFKPFIDLCRVILLVKQFKMMTQTKWSAHLDEGEVYEKV